MAKDKYVETVAKNIKTLREGREMSQEKLANLCGHTSNSARSWVSKIEKGERNIVISELYKIAIALDVTPSTLYIEFPDFTPDALRLKRLLLWNDILGNVEGLKNDD